MEEYRLQHIEADVAKRKQQRPGMQSGIALSTVERTGSFGRTRGDAGQHLLVPADTGVVTHLPAIDGTVDEHPIDPSLQHRWHTEPPKREVHDQQVGLQQFALFCNHVLRCRVVVGVKPLLGLRVKTLTVRPRLIVSRPLQWIEAIRVQVRQGHFPSGRL